MVKADYLRDFGLNVFMICEHINEQLKHIDYKSCQNQSTDYCESTFFVRYQFSWFLRMILTTNLDNNCCEIQTRLYPCVGLTSKKWSFK